MILPTLYKRTSTGAIQQWTIDVHENLAVFSNACMATTVGVIRTVHGQVGGKLQTAEDVIKSGKNVGKKNETSAFEQAKAEAQAKWEKQLKKGYVKTLADAQDGKVDEIIEGGVLPMLAHRFDEHAHKIKYPAYVQPKLDGHRCIAIMDNGKCSLWSRTRKPITTLPHINKAVEDFAAEKGFVGPFDGELYHHDYHGRFEELSSFITKAKPGGEMIQYHIYDIVAPASEFQYRNDSLYLLEGDETLFNVETVEVADEDEVMEAFEKYKRQGYEGLIVRNAAGKYVNKRSYDLQKVKEFEDAEFEVVGVEEGRGKLAGHAIFVCKVPEKNTDKRMAPGALFRAKMKGDTDKLKEFFDHPERAIGKSLTVSFQGVTNKERVPRFPVALRFWEGL